MWQHGRMLGVVSQVKSNQVALTGAGTITICGLKSTHDTIFPPGVTVVWRLSERRRRVWTRRYAKAPVLAYGTVS